MATPNSYKDKYWDDLATGAEAKAGIPGGMLVAIKNYGEKSNNDQVSGAGARTPFQIIPATRKAILDKYGIDPYLSPENAAEGAALLLKESLDRNKGDVPTAIREYHGGTNRKNWGAVNDAYVARVVPGMVQHNVASATDGFGKWLAENPSTVEPQIEQVKALQERVASAPAGKAPEAKAAPDTGSDISEASSGFGQWLQQEKAKPEAPKDLGFFGGIKESVTGEQRATEATKTLPDWASMPELNQFSAASAKTGVGTMFAAPDEIVQVIQSNFPGVKIRKDEKGNNLITSSVDGKEYAIPPGMSVSDIPRVLGGLLAFTPAGRATSLAGSALAAGGTQAAIEASQAATGGDFSAKDVALTGLAGGLAPAVMKGVGAVGSAITTPTKAALSKLMGTTEARMVESAAAKVPAPAAAPVAAPMAQAAAPDLAQTAQIATRAVDSLTGKKSATEELAAAVAPDKEILASAERLGIKDYLQPEHFSTSQAYREIAQAAKSTIGSEGHAAETAGLEQIAQKADDLITKIGATDDLSTLSQEIKQGLQATQTGLEVKAEQLYGKLRAGIDAKTKVNPTNVLAFVKQQSEDLGGVKNLSAIEKNILNKLGNNPTYALLDSVRKDVGAAARMGGPFKDADTGLAKKLYSLITDDQQVVAEMNGLADVLSEAKNAVRVRKGIEDDLSAIFGKNIDGNIVGKLTSSVAALSKGDVTRFVNLVKSVPEDMRKDLVASGLKTAFGKQGNLNFNTYAQWYEGLSKNKQAYTAIMSNLPKQAQQSLKDLYNVSSGISKSAKERITTGRLAEAKDMFKASDGLASKVMDAVRNNAVAAVAATAASIVHPGLGTVVALALSKGAKTETLRAVDKLLSSSAFKEAVLTAAEGNTKQAATKLAKSVVFVDFVKKVKLTKLDTLSAREKWLIQALEAEAGNQPQVNSR